MFCDKTTINVKAGDGGNGRISFLHEKYKEFGGPDGGDGGKGGDIILEVEDNLNTLYFFKTHHKLLAENGEAGKARKSHGKNGADLILNVPRGTVVLDAETEKVVADLSDFDRFVIAKGGDGGFGNAHFISSTRQTPKVAELGEPGEKRTLVLELKMIADVGLVGLPSVGKSTLLSVVTAAKPKIAEYEFTTLIPNLGVVEEGNFGVERGFIMADIPGLIEGASEGKGLGDEFLRHIERTKLLVHILDATHKDLVSDYQTIRKELKTYKVDLADKPEIVVVNKIDAVNQTELLKRVDKVQGILKSKILLMSAVAHKNLPDVLHEIERKLIKLNACEVEAPKDEYRVFTIEDVVGQNLFTVEKVDGIFEIKGQKVEKFATRTNFENPHGVARLRDILKRLGIDKELRRKGAKEGDTIQIGDKTFRY